MYTSQSMYVCIPAIATIKIAIIKIATAGQC